MNRTELAARLDVIRCVECFDDSTLDQFATFLETAQDEDLFRMSPYRYAEKNKISEQEAVDLFLYATHAGILDFNWGILCPSCGAFLTTESGLRWLGNKQDCSLCILEADAGVDETVEVAFTISPAIREIRFHDLDLLDFEQDGLFVFFSTSIALFPEIHKIVHSAFQSGFSIEANDVTDIEWDFAPEHHLIMIPATHAVSHIPVSEDAETDTVEIDLLLDGQLAPIRNAIRPGPGIIRVNNRTSNNLKIGLLRKGEMSPTPPEERTGALYTLSPYLTGHQLISNQVFRDLFKSESIPAPGGLQLKNLTLMFTDLKDSTAMYERIGDFHAYSVVREHFALLRGIIAARNGAIVKTMGDAIMASFTNTSDAIEVAARMNKELKRMGGAEKLSLKIGIHTGPCVAIAENDQLDFFGQAVNIASRVQNVAQAQEIVVTQSTCDISGVEETIKKNRLKSTPDEVTLKGVHDKVAICRLR